MSMKNMMKTSRGAQHMVFLEPQQWLVILLLVQELESNDLI